METYQIQYEDMDGVTCRSSFQYKSIVDFIDFCKMYGVKYETFTKIRLVGKGDK